MRPGDEVFGWWEQWRPAPGRGYQQMSGICVVLSTSRHKATHPHEEARRTLERIYGEDLLGYEEVVWRSVTKADAGVLSAEVGTLHSDGSGSRRVRVLQPTLALDQAVS